jgi:hypothetical protein
VRQYRKRVFVCQEKLATKCSVHLNDHYEGILVVEQSAHLDGASWPKTKKLKLPDNMKILFIPPYSPELNPTEHLWDCIRENWFPNKTFKSMDAVEDALVDALVALENDRNRAQGLTGFNGIVNDIMNVI